MKRYPFFICAGCFVFLFLCTNESHTQADAIRAALLSLFLIATTIGAAIKGGK